MIYHLTAPDGGALCRVPVTPDTHLLEVDATDQAGQRCYCRSCDGRSWSWEGVDVCDACLALSRARLALHLAATLPPTLPPETT